MLYKPFFVYGTLKVGGFYAKIFDNFREKVEKAWTKGTLFVVPNGWFPAMVLDDKNVVHGELHYYKYKNFDAVLKMFDRIEGFNETEIENSFYKRKTVCVNLNNNTKVEAIVYVLDSKEVRGFPTIKNGIWKIQQGATNG